MSLKAEISEAFKGEGCIDALIKYLDEKHQFKAHKGKSKGIALKATILNQFMEEMVKRVNSKKIETIEGKGKKKRVYKKPIGLIVGGGGAANVKDNYTAIGKYMVNVADLRKFNLLVVKYVKNRQVLPKLPRQKIPEAVSTLILNVVENNDFNIDDFNGLSVSDQKLFILFVQQCHVDIGYDIVVDEVDEFDKVYVELMKTWKDGNTSKETVKQLRKHIIVGMQSKKIPVKTGLLTLQQLE
jgi:hypothetical protein